jgi:hypothetical protein
VQPIPLMALVLIASAGCATTGSSSAPFEPYGELPFGGPSFDAHSIRGSNIQMSDRSDGSWGGDLNGRFSQASIGKNQLVISGRVPTQISWKPSPQGLLLTVRGTDVFLVLVCEAGDEDCAGGRSGRLLREQEDTQRLCPDLGCQHVRYWRRRTAAAGPIPAPPLVIALFSEGLQGDAAVSSPGHPRGPGGAMPNRY